MSLAGKYADDTEALFRGEEGGFEGGFVVSEDGNIVRHSRGLRFREWRRLGSWGELL